MMGVEKERRRRKMGESAAASCLTREGAKKGGGEGKLSSKLMTSKNASSSVERKDSFSLFSIRKGP